MKKKQPDLILFLDTLLLLSIGIVMVLSASSYHAALSYGDSYYFFKRQLIWSALGLVGMFIVMNIDYSRYKKLVRIGFFVTVILLLVLFIPGVGREVKGATRWIGMGFVGFAPSEVLKISIVFLFASFISLRPLKIQTFKGFFNYLLVLGFIVILLMKQPDLGTTIVILGTSFCIFIAAGVRKTHLFGLGCLGLLGIGVLIKQAPYRWDRITGFLNLWENATGDGYQTVQSLFALGSGGLFGMGLGNSRQKFLHLPEQHTDFIFAIIGEELGFIGAFLVISLFFIFLWRGYRIAVKAPDRFSSLLAVGLTSIIAVQSLMNMGVVTGSLPVTGITLPFVSYGGSSLVFSLIGVGMLLNISKFSNK